MRILILLFLCNVSQVLLAQSDLEFIKVKNSDKSVVISVKNNGQVEYRGLVSIELKGMKSEVDLPISVTIKPESTQHLTVLRPNGNGKTSYSINFKSMVEESSDNSMISGTGITIYTKNSHKRSTQLAIYLEQNGIDYHQVNTSYNAESKQVFKNMLSANNLEGVKYKMPVVVYNGEVFYKIKNVKKFCQEKFANEGKFVKKSERRY